MTLKMMAKTETEHPTISDAELLRTIGHDLRTLYSDVIRQPLPSNIKAALARIDREQDRYDHQSLNIRQ
jgi:hypothetical protein